MTYRHKTRWDHPTKDHPGQTGKAAMLLIDVLLLGVGILIGALLW